MIDSSSLHYNRYVERGLDNTLLPELELAEDPLVVQKR